jgi:hypothetical protein
MIMLSACVSACACLCVRICLPICLCIPSLFFRLMTLMRSSPCRLCIPSPYFVRRLTRSPCSMCVCVSLYFFLFYVVRVVSKESRRVILPKTSCFHISFSKNPDYLIFRSYLQRRDLPLGKGLITSLKSITALTSAN